MITRRIFLARTATAALATPWLADWAEEVAAPPWSIHSFTKPYQKLSFAETADLIAEVGYDGIELPLRKNGQIVPERVEEDLPRMVDALKKHGKVIGHLTTDIYGPDEPHAEKVLRTAKALGITRYRLGFQRYDLAKPIQAQLDALKPALKDLAAMNKEIGVTGGIQNHSGAEYVGCAIWDLYELLRGLEPAQLGICFDIGHATIEGGLSWPVQARLLQPWFVLVYVKDAVWAQGPNGFAPKWGPLGTGVVRADFFRWLKTTGYRGAISQHCEYLTGGTTEDRVLMKRDLGVLQRWLT